MLKDLAGQGKRLEVEMSGVKRNAKYKIIDSTLYIPTDSIYANIHI